MRLIAYGYRWLMSLRYLKQSAFLPHRQLRLSLLRLSRRLQNPSLNLCRSLSWLFRRRTRRRWLPRSSLRVSWRR